MGWGLELEQLSVIGALAREAASAPVDPEVDREGRNRIVGIAAARKRPSRRPARAVIAFAFAAVAIASVALWLRPRPLQYEIVGGSGVESPYVSAPPTEPVDVRFSDGSEVRAEAGTRMRVDATYATGARVLLEKGGAISHVAHHKMSHWTFVAGPFEVRVIGTRFDLRWDPLAEEIDLRLREGSVEVRSPLTDGPIVVRAGQRFQATMSRRSMIVMDAEPAELPSSESDPAPVAAERAPAVLAPPPAPAVAHSSQRRETWQELLAHGEFESVVAAAQARGVDACVASCSAFDLRSLADAARYTGRTDLADRCLLSLRKRFPSSGQSTAAAFLLGRIHEPQATAERWYDTYLAEAPDGEFAAEALAGKMRIASARGGAASAKPLALEYLRRYPQGVHVKTARKIAGLD